jgi:hypothetical protein
MTIQSWKNEFYKIPAGNCKTLSDAITHSILKWNGLLPENLQKHNLIKCGHWLTEVPDKSDCFEIDTDSCALCHNYYRRNFDEMTCSKCPINILIGHDCDSSDNSPYFNWIIDNNPKPMIKILKKIQRNTPIHTLTSKFIEKENKQ